MKRARGAGGTGRTGGGGSRRGSDRGQIEQRLARGDIASAAELAEAALAAGGTDPMLFNLAAWRREELRDYAGAHRLIDAALRRSPGDVLLLAARGAVLRKEGRAGEALAVLDRVLSLAPAHASAWLERGYTLDDLREGEAARESYERAVAIDPNLSPALAKLADGAAKRGEAASGRALAARALAINPREPNAICALATMEIEAGDATAAERRLAELVDGGIGGDDRTRALTLLGDARDRLDRPAEAFATYRAAQANFREVYGPILAPRPGRPSHRAFIERIHEQVAGTPPPASAAESVTGAAARHVFLLGYPRSGTTLVENILASAPEVSATEERDTLGDTDEVLVANDGTMPDLDALSPELLTRLRAGYWQRVRHWAGDVSGRVFVDMNPFNGIKLPIIARLFPDARIVIMRRDPRDVVLSCFRINFTPSPAAWSFSELEETARHYDALKRLIDRCRETLPLACYEVHYRRLVSDFEPQVRALADFVGIGWSDELRRFDRTARRRGVRTASATQVRRGLYDGGGQWRRYEAELAPVLPILQPWVDRFGG